MIGLKTGNSCGCHRGKLASVMKFRKSWLSLALTSALLAVLVAKAQNSSEVDLQQQSDRSKLDTSVFEHTPANAESHQFSAEISRLLKILANSVYTDRKAVVRELLSNAIDAVEKQFDFRLGQASQGGGLDDISNYKIVVEVDKENSVLSFTDDGVGMGHDDLKNFLGVIANSGTAKFASSREKGSGESSMIGQFGVGFYSVLLVADKVAVISKNDNDPKQWIWETDASASFRITEDPKGNTLGRGTRVMLKLKADAHEFLDHDKLESIMKEYFGYDRHRIYLVKPRTVIEEVPEESVAEAEAGEKSEEAKDDTVVEVQEEKKEEEKKPKTKKVEKTMIEEVLISQNTKPIWLRNPSEVNPEEYDGLYKILSGDRNGKTITHIHFVGETATSESFRAILFIPERPPFSPFTQQDHQADIKLHVRGVFVTAKFEDFIPKHLSFVKGIIDSDELSLNISRDILQNSAQLRGIQKKVVKKIIEMMTKMASDGEKYKKFYDAYSSFIKLEISEKEDYRTLLSKLLRYKTTKSADKVKSLEQYVEDMPETQKKNKVIYYLAGKAEEVENSPFLGRFKEKGLEVILMTEPVDEHMVQRLEKYDEFSFENIAKDGIKMDEDDEKERKELEETFKVARKWAEKALKDTVERVVIMAGPREVPGSMKSSNYGWTGNMERLIMAQSSVKEDPMLAFFSKQKKILELNSKNTIVKEILDRANSGKADRELEVTLSTLTDAIMIWSGYSVRDTAKFASGIDRMTRRLLNIPVDPLQPESEEAKDSDHDDGMGDIAFREGEKEKLEVADEDEKEENDEKEKTPAETEQKAGQGKPKEDESDKLEKDEL